MADGTCPEVVRCQLKHSEITSEETSEKESIISSSDDESDNDLRCDICDKGFSGLRSFKQHMKSNKHAKAIQRQRIKTVLDTESGESLKEDVSSYLTPVEPYGTCEFCAKEFGCPESYQQHLASKGHRRKVAEHFILQQVKQDGSLNVDQLKELCKQRSSRKSAADVSGESSSDLRDKLPGSTDETSYEDISEDTYECQLCENAFSGLAPFIQHLKSKRHIKKEKEAEILEMLKAASSEKVEGASTPGIEKSMSNLRISEGIITCQMCRLSLSGFESALIHMKGKKHTRNVELKEWKRKQKRKDYIEDIVGGDKTKRASVSSNQEMQASNDIESKDGVPTVNAVPDDTMKDDRIEKKETVIKITMVKKSEIENENKDTT